MKRSRVRIALLVCGVVSSVLFVVTDVLGGMRYEGYRFTSQAVSELMALGAPSEAFVDPLFIGYDLLIVAFAVGLLLERGPRRRIVRTTGLLLMGYGAIGLTGPTLFEMHQRGAGEPGSDTPHVIVTGVIVMLTLAAIGFGAFAFGKRFRIYSFATIATMIALGVASVPYGVRIAAGEPTPGFGIIERINIYASLLWIAALAVAVMAARRRGALPSGDGADIGFPRT
jgi:hypothetical protein